MIVNDLAWVLRLIGLSVVVGAIVPKTLYAEHDTSGIPVVINVERLVPKNGIRINNFGLFFHDGNHDYFDKGTAVSEAIAFAMEFNGSHLEIRDEFQAAGPAEYTAVLTEVEQTPDFLVVYPVKKIFVDPVSTPYLSYFGRVLPTDDGFVGNDEPRAIRLFDESGRFTGPVVLEIYGRDVLDAGVFANDEQSISYWDIGTNPQEGPKEDLPIRKHPGLNGSSANPDGEPVRILDQLDPDKADFSVEPFPLYRIKITSGADAGLGGNWFDPDTSGEGLVLDVAERATGEKILVVDWFTYKADESGEQLWLHGMGEFDDGIGNPDEFKVRVPLSVTEGGSFRSPINPDSVDLVSWGSMDIQFVDCDLAVVDLDPDGKGVAAETFEITRLSPPPAGTRRWCDSALPWSWRRFDWFFGIDPH